MDESKGQQGTLFIFWPFVALWRLVTWVLGLFGRLVSLLIGLVLVIVGLILTATVAGAIIGIPLLLLGLMLIARGLF